MSTKPRVVPENSNLDELELRKEWLKEAKKQTLETLPTFINHIMNDYIHDYGTSAHAVAAIATAAAWAANSELGLTGFQAGFVMWDFIDGGWVPESKIGKCLIDYDKMLYPQYEDYFTKHTITKHTFQLLQKEARNELIGLLTKDYTEEQLNKMSNKEIYDNIINLYRQKSEDTDFTVPRDTVVAHWLFILLGNVPFGYTIKD